MKGARISYSPDELSWIKAFSDTPRRELHALFVQVWGRKDVSFDNLKALCKRKGWNTGRDGRFHKGQPAANKGRTMPYHPNSAATRFKREQIPHNWRGAGHESVDDKSGYIWMIVDATNPHTGAATRRVMKHRWLWEQANGPVPDGHRLKCLDGDRANSDPSNWEAIPHALAPRLNGRFGRGYDQAPAELKPTILATAKLEHKARQMRAGKDKTHA